MSSPETGALAKDAAIRPLSGAALRASLADAPRSAKKPSLSARPHLIVQFARRVRNTMRLEIFARSVPKPVAVNVRGGGFQRSHRGENATAASGLTGLSRLRDLGGRALRIELFAAELRWRSSIETARHSSLRSRSANPALHSSTTDWARSSLTLSSSCCLSMFSRSQSFCISSLTICKPRCKADT
ncbi:hypothetical protein ABH975_006729 [Bradyrhizobium ottawaense]